MLLLILLLALAMVGCSPAAVATAAPTLPAPTQPAPSPVSPVPPPETPTESLLADVPAEARPCLLRAWGAGAYAEIEAGLRTPSTTEGQALAFCSARLEGAPQRPVRQVSPKVIDITLASEAWLPIPTDDGYLSVAIGPYADAAVLALPFGGFRLYAGKTDTHDIVSFFSVDGLTWAREEGIRVPEAAFPNAVLLSDGRVRLYFQSAVNKRSVIKSAISGDGGVTFEVEPGVRIEPGWHGDIARGGVADSTIVRLPNDRWRMYYMGGDEHDAYMNGKRIVFLSAISDDGLNWTPEEGVRVDPDDWANPQAPPNSLLPFIAGSNAVVTDDGQVKLYFWGLCQGVCLSISEDGLTFGSVEQVYAIVDSPGRVNIGDPTILPRADGDWLMYYGNTVSGQNGIWIARRVRPSPSSVP